MNILKSVTEYITAPIVGASNAINDDIPSFIEHILSSFSSLNKLSKDAFIVTSKKVLIVFNKKVTINTIHK